MGVRLRTWVRPLAWASLVVNVLLVVTGGAVRLTDSGLGCPTWPRCSDSSFVVHRALGVHGAIEFSNRMITFVLTVVAIATLVAAWRSRRRDLWVPALVLALGVPAQAVIGGIVVRTHLNPWLVSLHLLCSLAMTGVAVLLLRRAGQPDGRPAVVEHGPMAWLVTAVFGLSWVVFYVGTVVTGAGPHAGDVHSKRNGLSALELSQLHADLVMLLVGLTVGLVVLVRSGRASSGVRRATAVVLGVELVQGAVGFLQYFTNLPILLVGLHMLGAALLSATVTWALLEVREEVPRLPR